MIGRLVLWGGDPYTDVQAGSLRDRVEQGVDELREAALDAYRAALDGGNGFAIADAAYTLTIARHATARARSLATAALEAVAL